MNTHYIVFLQDKEKGYPERIFRIFYDNNYKLEKIFYDETNTLSAIFFLAVYDLRKVDKPLPKEILDMIESAAVAEKI